MLIWVGCTTHEISFARLRSITSSVIPNVDYLRKPEHRELSCQDCAWRPAKSHEPTRRLAAILAVNVAGYSRLIEADEEGTLGRLKALRADMIEPKIAVHHGAALTRRTYRDLAS